MMRYVLECNWSGYTASQSRCCHREVITEKRAEMWKDKDIHAIRFDDNTHMSIHVRPAKYREKVAEIKGYSQLLWNVLVSGLKGSVSVNDLKGIFK